MPRDLGGACAIADEQQIVVAIRQARGNVTQAAKSVGVATTTLRDWIKKSSVLRGEMESARSGDGVRPVVDESIEDVVQGGDRRIVSVSASVTTVDELIASIQLDRTAWVEDRVQTKVWEGMAKVRQQDGTEELVCKKFHYISLTLKRRKQTDGLVVAKETLEAFRSIGKSWSPPAATRRRRTSDSLLEVAIYDVHFGKYAWGDETGNSYDLGIASRVFEQVVADAVARAGACEPIGKIVFPIGNDFVHVDNYESATTRGTRVDQDTRYPKVLATARAMAAMAIRRFAEIAPVDVVVIPGNHDAATALALGHILDATFEQHKHVTVDLSPGSRKYRRHGCSLIGFAHGNNEDPKSLPHIMAVEQRQAYSECRFRAWHVGHRHVKNQKTWRPAARWAEGEATHAGVEVVTIPSISGTDAWHFEKGYVGGAKAAMAFLWGAKDGPLGEFTFYVPESRYQQ